MGRIAKVLLPSDIDAVSSWLALQPVPSSAKPAAKLTNLASDNLIEKCGGSK
jgi:hypothetical protein